MTISFECPCCHQDCDDEKQVLAFQLNQIHSIEFAPLSYHTLLPPLLADGATDRLGVVLSSSKELVIKPALFISAGQIRNIGTSLRTLEWEPLCDTRAAFNQVGMTSFEYLEFIRGYQYSFGGVAPPWSGKGEARFPITTTSLDEPATQLLSMSYDEETLFVDKENKNMFGRNSATDVEEDKLVNQYVRIGFYLDKYLGYKVRYVRHFDDKDYHEYVDQLRTYRFGPLALKNFVDENEK